jgi:hypothetical protein
MYIDEQKQRCILCYETYQMEGMKSARLRRHYEQNIKKNINEHAEYFHWREPELRSRQKS